MKNWLTYHQVDCQLPTCYYSRVRFTYASQTIFFGQSFQAHDTFPLYFCDALHLKDPTVSKLKRKAINK